MAPLCFTLSFSGKSRQRVLARELREETQRHLASQLTALAMPGSREPAQANVCPPRPALFRLPRPINSSRALWRNLIPPRRDRAPLFMLLTWAGASLMSLAGLL